MASLKGIRGLVHGGRQPVAGAKLFVFAAGTGGYGGSGIPASSANASTSLLTSYTGGSFPTSLDTNPSDATYGDYYVTTDAGGNFGLSGEYACVPGTQVYLYVLGGQPSPSITNPASGLMAVLGQCPGSGSMASVTPSVYINEVTTVAAAYAFAGFATDAVHVSSSGTSLAQTGIANAFANAANLADVSFAHQGLALATTPAGNGTVPQETINTLGNILAGCINSSGANSSQCTDLFAYATIDGTSTGLQPTDTASAAINIAHHPSVHVADIYNLGPAVAPYLPNLAAVPTDFSIAIRFTSGGVNTPRGIAIDASGDVWFTNFGFGNGTSISEFSPLGVPISPSTGFTGGGLNGPSSIAIDASGNAWITNAGGASISVFSSAGLPISGTNGDSNGGLSSPYGIAVDGSGNAWIADEDSSMNDISEFSASGTAISGNAGYIGGGLSAPGSIAVDGTGNIWIGNSGATTISQYSRANSAFVGSGYGTNGTPNYGTLGVAVDSAGDVWAASLDALAKFSNKGVLLSGTGYTGGEYGSGGTLVPISIDGAGNVWTGNGFNDALTEFSSTGAVMQAIVPQNAAANVLGNPADIAVDGSGNIWASNFGLSHSQTIAEIVGAAAPVITPIAAGLPATPTADGSSRLGTRP